jgi:HNH endonuclease
MMITQCEICNLIFNVKPYRVRLGKVRFCSRKCQGLGRPQRTPEQIAADFWSKVIRSEGDGCWIWTGAMSGDGYGQLGVLGWRTGAHRFSYELTNGAIESGLRVLHRCDNPPCVRPNHLFVGTQADNVLDMVSKGRRSPTVGARNPNAKLSDDQVMAIRASTGRTDADLGREFGVTGKQIGNIRHRNQRNDVP